MSVVHPEITVKLIGTDGNAFALLGKMQAEMRRAKVPAGEIEEFMEEATAGDYNHLLATCTKWVNVT